MSGPVPYAPQPAPYQSGATPPETRWPIELLYWESADVTYSANRNALITNSPLAAGLFYGARGLGNAAARKRARQLAEPQWRLAGTGEAVLDHRGVALNGSWGSMRVEFAEVQSWDRDGDALRISVIDYYPLLLRSPDAQNLAAWFAHLSHGQLWEPLATETWQPAPGTGISFWEQRDPRFICGVPDGWYALTDPVYLSKAARDAAANQQRLLFLLRRSTNECSAVVDFNQIVNPETVSFLAADPASLERDALRFAGTKAERANGAVAGRPRVVLMNGERATMIDTTLNAPYVRVRLRELYVGRRGTWFMIGFTVAHDTDPQWYFDHYAPDFQTMIASWQWRM